jgi:RNA-binding motif X-linked protein 2
VLVYKPFRSVPCHAVMNPLTQIKQTQIATKKEIELGILEGGSWHDRFKHSAYVYVGGLPFELTEGDVLAVCSQYGEIVDVHLVKDRRTKKSRGFAFVAYEDQRSTVLAVDNLSGSRVGGRIIRVEHVDNYRKRRRELEGDEGHVKEEEDGIVSSDSDHHDLRVEEPEAVPPPVEEERAPARAPVPSWRDLVARREAVLLEKEQEEEEKKKKKKSRKSKREEKPFVTKKSR